MSINAVHLIVCNGTIFLAKLFGVIFLSNASTGLP